MNQKKRSQEKTKFSKLRLRSSSNKSCKPCSPQSQEKKSSYFSSILNESEVVSNSEHTLDNECDTIANIKKSIYGISTNTSSDINTDFDTPDINDFAKPKITNATKKVENKSNKNNNVTKRKTRLTSDRRINFKSDTNEEHVQLAIAMSKSLLDLENPEHAESTQNTFPSTQQKIMNVKQTLDQFGFKSRKINTQPNLGTDVKLRRGKKFKYLTPTLFLRSDEDRRKLIENNVSQIINNISIYNNTIKENHVNVSNNVNNKPRSFLLRDYYKEEPVLFNKSNLTKNHVYYNGVVQPSDVKVGVLLKDWLTIPGREATPPLEENTLLIDDDKMEVENESLNSVQEPISMSPELFSDTEDEPNIEFNKKLQCNTSTRNEKETIIESECSTKSISLLDIIQMNNNKNTSCAENVDSSLSPFPDCEIKHDRKKQITSHHHNLGNKNDENSDSLSPFECENIETTRSKKKLTPKKNCPSPKKYVVTPKGRRIISPNNEKKHSSCKKSISFIEKQNEDEDLNLNLKEDKDNNEICYVENFCNDSIECFDLTNSSDDEILLSDKDNANNKSLTITQLINDLSPAKCILHNEEDSQASIETIKLNTSKFTVASEINEEYSPEFDCLNISNNKVFYETLNNSHAPINDDGDSDHNSLSSNKLEIHDDEEIIFINKDLDNPIKTSLSNDNDNDNMKHTFQSPKMKTKRLTIRRSYSENFIDNKRTESESTKKRKLSLSLEEIIRNDSSYSANEICDNIYGSQSSISTCSDICDEELNYSCNSIYKRYDLSISDDDNDDDDDVDNYNKLSSNITNKSLQHPRVSKLSTPMKTMETGNLSNSLPEMITTNNIATPKTDLIINVENITPKGHYSDMDTPERNRELEKYGIKPMKRNKGVKILHYIYDSTHPYVNDSDDEENSKVTKRRKTESNEEICSVDTIQHNGNEIAESEIVEDMIFERKQSVKISSCRLPLHVAWHNLLMNSKELQESILTYTPIQVEGIYERLKTFGYKFHIQDIIAFLDKKCITIRIAQNSRQQKKVNTIK